MIKYLITILAFMSTSVFAGPKTYKATLTSENTIFINGAVTPESVAKVVAAAKQLDSPTPSKEPLYLVLNTGGGDIDAGIEMIENLQRLNRPVVTITAFAASMGFQAVQGLNTRLIQKNGTLMSHKAKGGFWGEFPGQMDSRYQFWLKRVENMDKVAVKRAKGKYTLESYQKLVENEFWCEGEDCIEAGFADALVNAQCDKSLSGTRIESERFIYEGMAIEVQVTFDKCPLNTGELEFQVLVNGRPLFRDASKETQSPIVVFRNLDDFNEKIQSYRPSNMKKMKKGQ
jgi:ATP-dependent protease ClpP protease subunit